MDGVWMDFGRIRTGIRPNSVQIRPKSVQIRPKIRNLTKIGGANPYAGGSCTGSCTLSLVASTAPIGFINSSFEPLRPFFLGQQSKLVWCGFGVQDISLGELGDELHSFGKSIAFCTLHRFLSTSVQLCHCTPALDRQISQTPLLSLEVHCVL